MIPKDQEGGGVLPLAFGKQDEIFSVVSLNTADFSLILRVLGAFRSRRPSENRATWFRRV